jgi:hypothetical protein
MDTETLLRRNVAELRSLLDLSYARERALVEHVTAFLFLLEGAAVAPDRVAKQTEIVDAAKATLTALVQQPVPNHGLFADYARLSAEHRAAMTLNAALNATLTSAQQQVANTTVELNGLRLRVMEADAMRDAVAALLNRPDLTDAVTNAARDVIRARSAAAFAQPRKG